MWGGGEFKGPIGGGGSLNDLEGADEPGLKVGGWVDVLKVEVMGGEEDEVTNRVGHMATMYMGVVPLTVLSMGDTNSSLLNVVTNELEARCSRWVGGVKKEKRWGREDDDHS